MDATLDWVRRLSSTLIKPAQPAVPLPEKRGWLNLNGKRFWFVLRSGRLSFFASENATTGGKRFNLAECHVRKVVSPLGLLVEITREKKSGKYVLSTDSPAELDLWFASIGVSAKSMNDDAEVLGPTGSVDAASGQVFGVPLRQVLATARHSSHGMLPNVVRDCLAHLDTPRAFATPCLFAQEVETSKLAPWVAAYNNGVRPFSPNAPATLIACLLKHYFKCLPAPLISEELHKELQAGRTNPLALRRVVAQMGADSRFVLRSLADLLNNVAFESKQEGNSAVELATVWAPLLLWRKRRSSGSGPEAAAEEEMFVLRSIMALGTMVLHYSDVFEEQTEEAIRTMEESDVDALEELITELKAATPRKEAGKKPLPSLADWAKELRSAPSRPQLPLTFREAAHEAAQKEREEGLGALDELEAELEAEKVQRKSGVLSPTVLSPSASLDWADVRQRPLPADGPARGSHVGAPLASELHARFVVALDGGDHVPDERQLAEVERNRAARASRRSNLSPEQLASLRGRLENAMGGSRASLTPAPAPAKDKERSAVAAVAAAAGEAPAVSVKQLVAAAEHAQSHAADAPPPPPSVRAPAALPASAPAPPPPAPAASSAAHQPPPDVPPLRLPSATPPASAAAAAAAAAAVVTARAEVSAVVAKLKFDVLAWAEASAFQLSQLHAQQQAELRRLVAEVTRPLDAALDQLVATSVLATPAPPPTAAVPAPETMPDAPPEGEAGAERKRESKKEKKEKKDKRKGSRAGNRSLSPPVHRDAAAAAAADPARRAMSPPPPAAPAPASLPTAPAPAPAPVAPAPAPAAPASLPAEPVRLPPPTIVALEPATEVAALTQAKARGEGPLLSKPLPARPPPKATSPPPARPTAVPPSASVSPPRAAVPASLSSSPPPPLPRPEFAAPPPPRPAPVSAPAPTPAPAAGPALVATTVAVAPSSPPKEAAAPSSPPVEKREAAKAPLTELPVTLVAATPPPAAPDAAAERKAAATGQTPAATAAAAVPALTVPPQPAARAAPLPSPNLARLDAALAQLSAGGPGLHTMSLLAQPPASATLGSVLEPGPVLVLKGADDPALFVEAVAVDAASGAELPLALTGVTVLGVLPDHPLPFRKLRLAAAAQLAHPPAALRVRFSLMRHVGSSYAATPTPPLLSEPIALAPAPAPPAERPQLQQLMASLVRAVRDMGAEPRRRAEAIAQAESLCAGVLLAAKDLVVETLHEAVTDEHRQALMGAAKTLGVSVAKLVRVYQEEGSEAAAERQAAELRKVLKEAVLAIMNLLPTFTGASADPSAALDLTNSHTKPTAKAAAPAPASAAIVASSSAGASSSSSAPPSADGAVDAAYSRFDPSRRLSLPPPSPKKAAMAPAALPPRPPREYTYAELWRDGDRKRSPAGCDIAQLETYLSDAEFAQVLKMTRAQFYSLPPWRQRQLKVAVRLW